METVSGRVEKAQPGMRFSMVLLGRKRKNTDIERLLRKESLSQVLTDVIIITATL